MRMNYLDVDNANEWLYASLLPISSQLRKSPKMKLFFGKLDAVDEGVCE